MKFNVAKCNIMRIARGNNPLTRFYSLGGTILEEVQDAKYLGVNIANNLSWSPHVSKTAQKANNTLAFIRRNLKKCPLKLKETAYLSLVRSLLEYSASVWDPYLQRDINELEKVQRRACRFVNNDYDYEHSVTGMMKQLGWPPLSDRRREIRLTLMYKIVHELVAISTNEILTQADSRTRSVHSKELTFKHIPASTLVYSNSFFPKTIREWNPLPDDTVQAKTVPTFKQRLKHD